MRRPPDEGGGLERKRWPRKPAADDAVGGEILEGDRAASLRLVGGDQAADLARVELLCALVADRLERRDELAQVELVTGDETFAGATVDGAPLIGVAEDEIEDRVQIRLLARQLDAGARQLDRRRDQRSPRRRPVSAVHALEAERDARDRG
jgi:hypothetical protein